MRRRATDVFALGQLSSAKAVCTERPLCGATGNCFSRPGADVHESSLPGILTSWPPDASTLAWLELSRPPEVTFKIPKASSVTRRTWNHHFRPSGWRRQRLMFLAAAVDPATVNVTPNMDAWRGSGSVGLGPPCMPDPWAEARAPGGSGTSRPPAAPAWPRCSSIPRRRSSGKGACRSRRRA